MPAIFRSIKHARRLKNKGCLIQVKTSCMKISVVIVGDGGIDFVRFGLPECFLLRKNGHQFDAQTEILNQVVKKALLHRFGQHRNALALQIEERGKSYIRMPVNLGPAIQCRRLMKIQHSVSLLRVSDVVQQIELLFVQHPVAFLPYARYKLELPVFLLCNLAQNIDHYAAGFTVLVDKNFRLIRVNTDSQLLGDSISLAKKQYG